MVVDTVVVVDLVVVALPADVLGVAPIAAIKNMEKFGNMAIFFKKASRTSLYFILFGKKISKKL